MNITFPHLGPLHIAVSGLLSYLHIPHTVPHVNNEEVLLRGSAISPEEMCLPFKYMAGNLIDAYDNGADTALMISTNGPCRLGMYGELLKSVLDEAGYGFNWILLGTHTENNLGDIISMFKKMSLKERTSIFKIVKGIVLSVRLIFKYDSFRKKLQMKAGYLREPIDAVNLLNKTDMDLLHTAGFKESFRILRDAKRRLDRLETEQQADPVKILVVGEIYTSIEPEANCRLEEKLMAMGCSIKRPVDISWWIKYTVSNIFMSEKTRRIKACHQLLKNNTGGYARETVISMSNDRWSDGIIKIMPSGCMPEIVAKALARQIEEEKDKKILHLIYDEMSGQAGYETRIEAFIDMLERRKNVLAGNRYRIDKY